MLLFPGNCTETETRPNRGSHANSGAATRANLEPLYDLAAGSIRAADPSRVIMFSTTTWADTVAKPLGGSAFSRVPGGNDHVGTSVLAFHYCKLLSARRCRLSDFVRLRRSAEHRRHGRLLPVANGDCTIIANSKVWPGNLQNGTEHRPGFSASIRYGGGAEPNDGASCRYVSLESTTHLLLQTDRPV